MAKEKVQVVPRGQTAYQKPEADECSIAEKPSGVVMPACRDMSLLHPILLALLLRPLGFLGLDYDAHDVNSAVLSATLLLYRRVRVDVISNCPILLVCLSMYVSTLSALAQFMCADSGI
jgi:hypothetical protein